MGYMALLRNLRNFEQAGISPASAQHVADVLADPERVATSRQLPMRFLSAYKAVVGTRYLHAIETALDLSLRNVPALPGRSLILVDRSGSMWGTMSGRSELTRADAGAVFGAALAIRAEYPQLVLYGSSAAEFPARNLRGAGILPTINRFGGDMGGTYTGAAVQSYFAGHDRVVIVTDEQAHDQVRLPDAVPLYIWNLAGYRHGNTAVRGRHFTFGGLSDQAFAMIPLLERGGVADWPF